MFRDVRFSRGSRIFCLGGLMGRVFFVWGGLMGIKRRRRETAIAEGAKRLPKKISDLGISQKNFIYLQKISDDLFFFLVIDLFYVLICFLSVLQLEQNFGGLNPSFNEIKAKKLCTTLGIWGG